jgi:hypothetical protein
LAEQNLKRYEHYSSRFIDHKKAIDFAKRKQAKLKVEVEAVLNTLKTTNPAEFDSYLEAAELIIEARTGLAYSYPLGYFMTSPSKLSFYEFLQGELEHSLDILDQKTDLKLKDYLTLTPAGIALKDSFYFDRSALMSFISTVRTHFFKSIREMEMGFPEISEVGQSEAKEMERQLLGQLGTSNQTINWICSLCTFQNEPTTTACSACQSARYSITN